jgi:hypothetical protein
VRSALGTLCSRVTPDEARHLLAQHPSKLHPELESFRGQLPLDMKDLFPLRRSA